MSSKETEHKRPDELANNAILEEIGRQLAQIQFGSLEIQIHNGQIVQLERREKKRWDKPIK